MCSTESSLARSSSVRVDLGTTPTGPRWECSPSATGAGRIGVGTCELLGVVGLELTVRGLDAIDGTPVLDIKPYMAEFAPRGPVRQPAWSNQLMSGYW